MSPLAADSPKTIRRYEAEKIEPVTIELPDMVGGSVAVVTLNPGDTLVLTSSKPVSPEMAERIHQTVTAYLPGIKCMVMDSGLAVGGVIRREANL